VFLEHDYVNTSNALTLNVRQTDTSSGPS